MLCLLGGVLDLKQFGYSWLLAFMFYLSLVLGALFLVMMHHLFDAGWSVGIRRFCEHLACLVFPWMAIFFLPIALLAPKIYQWMSADPRLDMTWRRSGRCSPSPASTWRRRFAWRLVAAGLAAALLVAEAG